MIFVTWFTYDTTGKAWWLGMQANRTATGTYAGTIFTTHLTLPTDHGPRCNIRWPHKLAD